MSAVTDTIRKLLAMALYRVNGITRWYESDSDDVLGFGAAQSARKLIAFRTSN